MEINGVYDTKKMREQGGKKKEMYKQVEKIRKRKLTKKNENKILKALMKIKKSLGHSGKHVGQEHRSFSFFA